MRNRTAGRVVLLAVATAAVLLGTALPASAAVSNYDVEYESGRIRVVNGFFSQNFDTPGTSVGSCAGATTINGTINDAGGVDTITGNLSISSPFTFTLFGTTYTYILTVSGSATGTNAGNYSGGANGTFTSMQFTGATFTVRNYNATTCTAGTQVCGSSSAPTTTAGTLNLTASGGVATGSSVPLSINELIYVNANGSFTNAGCSGGPLQLVIANGATISLGDNPNDCYLAGTVAPCSPADPGAIFRQRV